MSGRAGVRPRLTYYNGVYNFRLRRVFIKNTKARWGSASSRGNLNFNYKIIFLPPALCDYIIVHELCHLAEFNHSPKFWALVARACPEHKVLRRRLRAAEYSPNLHHWQGITA